MPLPKDKKILIYLFLLTIFGSINNKYFSSANFFEIKNLRLVGLSNADKEDLLIKFEKIKKKKYFLSRKKRINKNFKLK